MIRPSGGRWWDRASAGWLTLVVAAALVLSHPLFRVAADQAWNSTLAPSVIGVVAPADVTVTVQNLSGNSGSGEGIGCVTVAIPASFLVTGVTLGPVSNGKSWSLAWVDGLAIVPTIVTVRAASDPDTLRADFETLSFTVTTANALIGSYTWTADEYKNIDCTGNYNDTVGMPIDVALLNLPPSAVDDAYPGSEDTTLTVPAASGVLANDSDPEAGPLTASVVSDPASGSLVLASDGSFTYTPDPNTNGADSFSYLVTDNGGATDSGTVDLSIAPANDPPVAQDDAYAATEDTPLTVSASGVLANDADVDGDLLSASMATNPSHGMLSLAADGGFTYTPDPDFNGSDSFTYIASDPSLAQSTATVDVTVGSVNDPPKAAADAYGLDEDTTLVVPAGSGLLANDSDVDGDPLTAGAAASTAAGGYLAVAADGSFSYTPPPDYNGTDTFTYTVTDAGGLTATGTVTLTIDAVNDPPNFVAGPDQVVDEDAPAETLVGWATAIGAGPPDEAGQALTFLVMVDRPELFASTPAIDAATGTLTFRPAPNGHGVAIATIVLLDAGGTTRGGSDRSAAATVRITVQPVNDPPKAAADAYGLDEDTTLVVPAGSGLLANDSDVDGDPLTAGAAASTAAGGYLAVAADGSFSYTPPPDYNGTDTFTYTVTDAGGLTATATATLIVAAVDDSPAPTVTPAPIPESSRSATPTPTPTVTPAALPTPMASPDGRFSAGQAAGPDSPATPPTPAGRGTYTVPDKGANGAGLVFGFSFAGLSLDWFIPGLILGVPGLLVILAIALQLAGGLLWIPAIRRNLGGFGFRRTRRDQPA